MESGLGLSLAEMKAEIRQMEMGANLNSVSRGVHREAGVTNEGWRPCPSCQPVPCYSQVGPLDRSVKLIVGRKKRFPDL